MKPSWKIKVSVANSEEEFKNTTVEELKRKVLSEDEYENSILAYYFCTTLKKNRTLGFYGIKHEDEITKVPRGTTYTVTSQTQSSAGHMTEVTYSFEDDNDDEEGKDISRTQSMDNLALMQKTNPRPIL
ncbi:hypothetical protein QQF64_023411 [Cirrhinus molitorella]